MQVSVTRQLSTVQQTLHWTLCTAYTVLQHSMLSVSTLLMLSSASTLIQHSLLLQRPCDTLMAFEGVVLYKIEGQQAHSKQPSMT